MARAQATEPLTLSPTLPKLSAGELRVLEGPDRGTSRRVTHEPHVVGSGDGCEVTLADPKVSRKHLEVRLGAHGFFLRDLGSRNGTLFEGSKVSELSVPPGAAVRIGHTVLLLTTANASDVVAPSSSTQLGELLGK